MMRFLQRLGKALMLPVATLPICGILMGIGYALSPNAMQGGAIEGALEIIGFFLIKAGGALIDNMAILFAIGVGVGMADDKDGTAGLAALASWLMITSLLNTNVVATIAPHMLPLNAEGVIDTTSTNYVAFSKVANPFIGILSGLIGGLSYNKFKNTKLPDFLSFFSGKRCVAIVAGMISVVVSAILLFVWPVVFSALVALGKGIASMGAVGAGLYAFFNRLLIPTGLHHALNNVFWFDTIGLGDLSAYWGSLVQGDTMANGTEITWSVGMYMAGFFPCMMFGVPAAAFAMYRSAKPEKRKVAMGILLSAAIASFVCGVTEPFEFAFMFLAPGLYVVYAALYGIFVAVTTIVGFRAGFSFSAGLTDLVFSSTLPAAKNTWMIIPLGVAAAIIFYVVFRFAIVKFNLKTPGREDDDPDEVSDGALANNDYTAIAKAVLEGLGGASNVTTVDNCITRLRLEVKDSNLVNEKAIKAVSSGVIRPSKTSVQVIIGPKVQFVADEFKKLVK